MTSLRSLTTPRLAVSSADVIQGIAGTPWPLILDELCHCSCPSIEAASLVNSPDHHRSRLQALATGTRAEDVDPYSLETLPWDV